MDAVLRGMLRRYAGGDHDDFLAHRIVHTVLRKERVIPIPTAEKQVPCPPKSFDELLGILTKDIIPLKVINEWDDDHETCGQVAFMVEDKCYKLDLWWCGAKTLGAFEFPDSAVAHEIATEAVRDGVALLFDHHYEWKLNDIREQIENGWDINIRMAGNGGSGGCGLSRAYMGRMFQRWGQEAFEQAFGPLQPWTWAYPELGKIEQRYACARELSITPKGTFWHYNTTAYSGSDPSRADYSKVVTKLPVDTPLLHKLVKPEKTCSIGCWPF